MAECSVSQIIVSGAGLTAINGTYVTAGTITQGTVTSTVYTKDGNADSFPRVRVSWNPGPNFYSWEIFANIPIFGNQPIYTSSIANSPSSYTPETLPACPVELTYITTGGPWGSSTYLPAPTVTAGGGSPENTFGLPADVVALITSRFGTVANFLRLRNQGQI
jgi:hypothetical protein